MTKYKWILTTLLLSSILPTSASAENLIACVFDQTHVTYLNSAENRFDRIQKMMTIEKGITNQETVILDGAQRATNSTNWVKLINPNLSGDNTLNFAGDSGDLLTILLNSKINDKYGSFLSTVSYTYSNYSITYVGKCVVR